jgi:hypothetical protein
MTRDFIFDSSGAVIGYRCRCEHADHGKPKIDPFYKLACNRFFATPRGLWQHQRRAHGLSEQLWLVPPLPGAPAAKGKRK